MRRYLLMMIAVCNSLNLIAQNIGIGIASPRYKLDVKGSVNIDADSAYRINGARFLWGGNSNLYVGYGAGANSTISSGSANCMIGLYAGANNVSGANNTFVGTSAGGVVLTGSRNSYFGVSAGYSNNTGSDNSIFGSYAGVNSTGNYNSYFGSSAGFNTMGNANVGMGFSALYSNVLGNNNTAMGYNSLKDNKSNNSTAVGYSALEKNINGDANTALGYFALNNGTAGFQNCAFGYQSLYNNNSNYNTAFGTQALYNNISGTANVAIGGFSGYSRDGLANCTLIGYGADASTNSMANAIAIGYTAIVDASNKVRIGNTSIGSIGGQVGWTTFSDGRYKRNIKEDVKGLDFVMQLRPVTYTVDQHALNNRLHIPDSISIHLDYSNESVRYTGLIAQEVEAAALSLGFDFSAVDKPKDPDGLYGIRYAEFVVPLIKAIQEQQQEIELLKKQQEDQKKINEQLMKRLEKLESTPTIKN